MYLDMMDPTRLVKVDERTKSLSKKTVAVRVYFRNLKNLRQDPEFAGKSEIPLNLFGEHPSNRFIGFQPWNREAELEKQRQIEALQQRTKYQELEEDFDEYED